MVLRPKTPELDLLNDIPRGNPNKFLKDQVIPMARFQQQEKIGKLDALSYDPKKPYGKILIGALGAKLIGVFDERHILTVAGNRSGKSVTVDGNLFFYDGSIFSIDPKGNSATNTAVPRSELGQKVFVLDPYHEVTGEAAQFRAQYNPLMVLSLNSRTVKEQSLQIVHGIVEKQSSTKDPHWDESAENVIQGIVLYVRFGSNVKEEDRHLGTVRRLITKAKRKNKNENGDLVYVLPRQVIDGIQHLYKSGHGHIAETIENNVRALYEAGREEMSGILSTMKRHTAFLELPAMQDVMKGHDFNLRDLKRDPKGISIYLVLPASRMGDCNRWYRILINQLIETVEMEKTIPRVPVLCILDEFPVLGRMEQLEKSIGYLASMHLKLWIICQDWSQGKSLYKERWDSFVANCGLTQWFANIDLTTTEYLSKKLGKTPVVTTRQSDSSHDQMERGLHGKSQSIELYDLMTPEEISRYFARDDIYKRQLIMVAGKLAMITQRVEWWNKKTPYSKHFNCHA